MSESENEYDKAGLQAYTALREDLAARWVTGTNEILKERNPELLASLTRLENIVDSLIAIPKKPKSLQKELTTTLEQYRVIGNDCIAYASRHLNAVHRQVA